MTPEELVDEVLTHKVSEYKACERCAGYHASSFADPPSYHEPDPEIPCAMCEDRHLTHALAGAIRAAVAEEREACAQNLDAIVAQHRSRQHEFAEARFTMSGDPVPQTCAAGAFCEDFGCHSFIDAAAAIRARV